MLGDMRFIIQNISCFRINCRCKLTKTFGPSAGGGATCSGFTPIFVSARNVMGVKNEQITVIKPKFS